MKNLPEEVWAENDCSSRSFGERGERSRKVRLGVVDERKRAGEMDRKTDSKQGNGQRLGKGMGQG